MVIIRHIIIKILLLGEFVFRSFYITNANEHVNSLRSRSEEVNRTGGKGHLKTLFSSNAKVDLATNTEGEKKEQLFNKKSTKGSMRNISERSTSPTIGVSGKGGKGGKDGKRKKCNKNKNDSLRVESHSPSLKKSTARVTQSKGKGMGPCSEENPTENLNFAPSFVPTSTPNKVQSDSPSTSHFPSREPSGFPSDRPFRTFSPTYYPTKAPSNMPTVTSAPSYPPSLVPSTSSLPSSSSTPSTHNCASSEGRRRDTTEILKSLFHLDIESSNIFGKDTLERSQQSAITWILEEDELLANACNGPTKIVQRYTLAIFYFSTLGDTWKKNEGWLGSEDECTTWYGILCDSDGNIDEINLSRNNLSGTIPPELGAISTITSISFYDNIIGGTVPKDIFRIANIKSLDIEENNFSGIFFSDELFDAATSIVDLLISNNRFTGMIPTRVGELSLVENFWAAGNKFSGLIPSEITQMTNIESLFLYSNDFNGSIPREIGSMTNIAWLDISENPKMLGEIPVDISACTKLEELILHNTGLRGEIPSSIHRLKSLRKIFLSDNNLNGTIPTEMGSLENLEHIILNNNSFTGQIPDISKSKGKFFDLSQNKLSGHIPQYLFEMNTMEDVYLSNNALSGPIPSWDIHDSLLRDIWLDGNELTGTIPDLSSGALPEITEILIFQNNLSGTIPHGICNIRREIPEQFKSLQADCHPLSTNIAQNPCEPGCCTKCFSGKDSSFL